MVVVVVLLLVVLLVLLLLLRLLLLLCWFCCCFILFVHRLFVILLSPVPRLDRVADLSVLQTIPDWQLSPAE